MWINVSFCVYVVCRLSSPVNSWFSNCTEQRNKRQIVAFICSLFKCPEPFLFLLFSVNNWNNFTDNQWPQHGKLMAAIVPERCHNTTLRKKRHVGKPLAHTAETVHALARLIHHSLLKRLIESLVLFTLKNIKKENPDAFWFFHRVPFTMVSYYLMARLGFLNANLPNLPAHECRSYTKNEWLFANDKHLFLHKSGSTSVLHRHMSPVAQDTDCSGCLEIFILTSQVVW